MKQSIRKKNQWSLTGRKDYRRINDRSLSGNPHSSFLILIFPFCCLFIKSILKIPSWSSPYGFTIAFQSPYGFPISFPEPVLKRKTKEKTWTGTDITVFEWRETRRKMNESSLSVNPQESFFNFSFSWTDAAFQSSTPSFPQLAGLERNWLASLLPLSFIWRVLTSLIQ